MQTETTLFLLGLIADWTTLTIAAFWALARPRKESLAVVRLPL